MKLIMENWNGYQQRVILLEERVENEFYITETLGIKIPLNESYPFSPTTNQEILNEHLLFEGFWGDLGQKIKQGATEKWEAAKAFPGQIRDIFIMLYKAFAEGKTSTFVKAVGRKALGPALKKLNSFLDKVIEYGPKLKLPAFANAAEKIKNTISELVSKYEGRDWKSAMAITGVAAGIKYILEKLGDGVDKVISSANPVEILKDLLKEKAMELMGGVIKKITSQITAAFGDITAYWEWLVAIAGGAQFAYELLKEPMEFFSARGGMNETYT